MMKIKNIKKICNSTYEHPDGGTGDFCICYEKGTWHLFHILHEYCFPVSCHHPDQTRKIAHASSPDLIHWQFHKPAIQARPDKWDSSKVWAPGINKYKNTWFMSYTGVDEDIHQRIGIVKSTDLWHWEYPMDSPIIDAASFPWSKKGGVNEDAVFPFYFNCRDPFLYMHEGKMLCYYTSRSTNGENEAVMGLASSDDFLNWKDEGYVLARPIFNGEGGGTYMTESPFVFKKGEYFFLMFNQGRGVRYVTSKDPYDFTNAEPLHFMDHIINFDLIDIETGLYAFSQHNKSLDKDPTLSGSGYQHIHFGRCEITGDMIKPLIPT